VRRRAAPDEDWVTPQSRSSGLKVAVAYPNTYRVGMSNLGYQAVLKAFLEAPGFQAGRVFYNGRVTEFPDGGHALDDFDAVAFSVSYQPDLVHLPRMLETAKAALIIGGGVALTINPETSAGLFDAIVLGDSEPVLPGLMKTLLSGENSKEGILARLDEMDGIYVPGRRHMTIKAEPVARAVLPDLDRLPARPAVLSKRSEFGDMYPLEVSRGCGAGCRFCAAGSVCAPVRFLGLETFKRESELGLRYRRKIGLVGTAVSFHPRLNEMAAFVLSKGGIFSPSSIRAERVTPELAELLVRAGHKTVSLAPEAGTEELRASLGKGMGDGDFLNRVDILLEAGVPNLKLYFMAGLPGEEDSDAAAVVDFTAGVRDRMIGHGKPRGKVGTLTVSVNPFVPKPQTAFESATMAGETVLSKRLEAIRKGVTRLGGVKAQIGSVRRAYLDALLSLGDRSVTDVLDKIPPGGVSLKRLIKIYPHAENVLFGERERVWEFIR
jgi:radical SAM superfamily enzyme YgiQ (UPF0313 family)